MGISHELQPQGHRKPAASQQGTTSKEWLPIHFFDMSAENCQPSAGNGDYTPGCYEQLADKIPDLRSRVKTLAHVADALQAQVNALREQIGTLQLHIDVEHAGNDAGFKSTDASINALGVQVAYLMQQEQMRKLQPNVDDLKRELEDFKAVACPVLRTARVRWDDMGARLDSACGSH